MLYLEWRDLREEMDGSSIDVQPTPPLLLVRIRAATEVIDKQPTKLTRYEILAEGDSCVIKKAFSMFTTIPTIGAARR